MSDSPLLSKSKSDLAAIAHMSGLLTPKDTSRMTKAQLLAYMLKVEDEAKAKAGSTEAVKPDKPEEPEPAEERKPAKPAAERRRKSVMKTEEPKSKPDTEEEEAPKPKRGRPRKIKSEPEETPAALETPEPAETVESTPPAESKPVVPEEKQASDPPAADISREQPKRRGRSRKPDKAEKTERLPADESAAPAGSTSDANQEESADDTDKDKDAKAAPQEMTSGVLEIMPDGYGFLRIENYLQGAHDIYVPPQYIRRFGLRSGDLVTGPCRQQRDSDRYRALYYIKEVNGQSPDKMLKRPHFDRLTPIYPDERFVLETTRNELSTRIIDLVSPIGKGQRGMIVSPPKAGKTILLQKIANAISINNPDSKLIVLLIDERPEEVTDMQRSINGEVVFSTFDKTPENHVKVTELVLERAMRLVELKQDVVILLDSLTRMGRAYNLTITPTGRTLSGGLDPGALYGPKRFFGAARNIEHGGSLTIIATSLIETGSRMDEVIFEEFKGTGNMEVLLDRKLSEKRIFPAIDITRSSTRREELLLSPRELDSIWAIRKAFGQLDTAAVTETIINLLLKTRNNEQFIQSVNVSFNDKNLYEAMRGQRLGGNGQS